LELHVSLGARGQLAANVYRALREAILDGRLRGGERMPSSRTLADQLRVARNTVLDAYDLLVAEGYAEGRAGSGTYVSKVLPTTPAVRHARPGVLRPVDAWRDARPTIPRGTAPFDFRIGYPDPALFPFDAWRHAVGRQLHARNRFTGYPPPEGDPALRAAIARHVGLARGVIASDDDIVVTTGAQQALDLIARVLVDNDSTVAVEDPGYAQARRVFAAAGARIAPVPVDAEGIVVDRIPDGTRVVYVTPSHQFPLGMPMSLARRLALLAWAERTNAAIVEDDYDSEFRSPGRSLESLQSLDRTGRVLYVGTFSKVLLPTLRIGYVVVPGALVAAVRAAKELVDSHVALAPQRALASLIDDGTFARHVRRIDRIYDARRATLLAALACHEEYFELIPATAGLHVAVLLRDRRADATEIGRRAAKVAVAPLAVFSMRHPRSGFALGFGLIERSNIEPGLAALVRALRSG